jgi:GTPase-associated protein 1, N-terminal domain type 2/GTPase-associated protein 1, middle domain
MGGAALQLQYTSCRAGVRGGKGFQTRALSEGLRADEQREVEGQGGYSPPRDASTEPAWDEIERDFPVLFRFYRLASGRFAITRSQYSGQDYSERWGNFFAHSLVLDEWPAAVWPIDFYEWPGWKRRLEPAEDTETAPGPLPAVALEDIAPSPSFTFAELQAFLRESPGRGELLAAMIRAVFAGRRSARVLVVRDSPLNGAFWIACVQKAFPLRHALTLSQSTYQFDPRDCAALNATTTGTGFSFDETQRKFQFSMFDLVESANSEVVDEAGDYAAAMSRWMTEEPELAAGFHRFMAGVDHESIGPELPQFLSVFRMARGDTAGLDLPAMVDALQITARHIAPAQRAALFEPLADGAVWSAAEGTPEQLLALLSALAQDAGAATDRTERAPLARTWLRCFETIRNTGRWSMLPVLSESRDAIAALAPEAERGIAVHLLSPAERKAIGAGLAAIPDESAVAAEWLLGELLRSARSVGSSSTAEPVQEVIAAARGCNRGAAAAILRAFGADPSGLAAACATLAWGESETEQFRRGEKAGLALFEVLGTLPPAVCTDVRRALDRRETWPVLFHEWLATLNAARGRRELYVEYCNGVLSALPGFDRACRGAIATSFAETLDAKARGAAALTWIRVGEVDRFPPEIQRWCVDAAAATIVLSRDGSGADAARIVTERAQRLEMRLEPDRPFLRLLLEQVASPKETLAQLELARLPAALRSLDRAEYVEFLYGFLHPVLALADEDDHDQVLRACFVAGESDSFAGVYTAALTARGRSELPVAAVTGALRFWLVRVGDGGVPGSGALNEPVLQALAARLARMPRADLEKLKRRIRIADSSVSQARAKWNWVQQEIERHQRSIFARARDMLRGNRS